MRQALQALVLIVTGSIYRRGYTAAQDDIAERLEVRAVGPHDNDRVYWAYRDAVDIARGVDER